MGMSFGILGLLVGLSAASVSVSYLLATQNTPSLSAAQCVLGGVVLAVVAQHIVLPRVVSAATGRPRRSGDDVMYGLDHGKLNVQLPPPSMWMNMGYWKETSDFPTACRSLLMEVLKRAGLVTGSVRDGSARLAEATRPLSILDLGYGCGDQTMAVASLAQGTHFRYVGVTLNRTQHRFAQDRLSASAASAGHNVRLFCDDAAKPGNWAGELREDVNRLAGKDLAEASQDDAGRAPRKWVLALDTLYHFSPSRSPVFRYAANELGASIMAFDLVRSDSASFVQRSLLKLTALASGCPSHAFVTEAEYRAMLSRAGYAEESIEISDITEHVFAPLARFMRSREGELETIGLKMGSLKAAGALFRWWARSGIVRGVIVVARRDTVKSS
ncbi:hypothetical protein BX600DRAFT_475372 [Xylariales sp. PMI_506]|nr:hypothetical protein BX600DRAFT_475372 [Xylariales sp. PMI_506]